MALDIFNARQKHIADVFKAVALPEKVAILEYIFATKDPTKYEIIHDLGLAPAEASFYLNELEDFGIIQTKENLPVKRYCMNTGRWEDYQSLINTFFDRHRTSLGKCC